MKRNVVYIIDSIHETGPVFQLRELIRGLPADEFDVAVISLCHTDQGSPFFDGIAALTTMPRCRFGWLLGWELRKAISAIGPDIVHSWSMDARIPAGIAVWNSGVRHFTSVFEKPTEYRSAADDWSQRFAPGELVASHRSISESLKNVGLASRAVCQAAPANRLTDRQAARNSLLKHIGVSDHSKVWLAGTVTRFEPRYRLKDLVWAIDLLCCVRQDIHLVVFGRGCQRSIRNYLAKLDCSDNVHFLDPDQIRMSLIAGLDMYWNSQTVEPNPTAMLFAMQHQIPIISVLSDETSELVLPLKSALATNYGSRDEFARWTKYLIELPEAAQQIGLQAKQHVENMLATDSMVKAYRKLYIDSVASTGSVI